MTTPPRRAPRLRAAVPSLLLAAVGCAGPSGVQADSAPPAAAPVAVAVLDERPAPVAGPAGGEQPVASLGRPGDGSPTCGLGADFHAGRRTLLAERLGGDGHVLVRGLPETRDYNEFRQDKVFWYLTGVESPDASLYMDLASGLEVLFLPGPNPRKESWDGELWDSDDAWVRTLTGFEHVRPADELDDFLADAVSAGDTLWVSRHPWIGLSGGYDRAGPHDRHVLDDPLDGRVSRETALERKLVKLYEVEVDDLAPTLNEMRRVKTAEELDALRRAGVSGARAMAEAIRSTAPGVGEWEIDALIGFEQQRQGADGMAYHAIVGSGPNSCVLHYSASTRRMRDGDLLLIDAGSEVDHYTTDITRTWPVNGRFDEHQAALYDAVLAAQEAGIAAARPGASIRDVDRAANDVLRERGYGALIMHGVCHYVGMEVHDPSDYAKPLEPGVVFTIEPGAYDIETGDGVRIEDVVVITADGCELLTRDVPVSRESMERMVAEHGILDGLRAGS